MTCPLSMTGAGPLSTELCLPTANCHRPAHDCDIRLAGVRPQFTSLRTGARQYRPSPSAVAPYQEPSAALRFLARVCLGNLIGIDIRIGIPVMKPPPSHVVVMGRREGRQC